MSDNAIPMETLFETYTSAAQVREATAAPSVATGRYRFQASRAEGLTSPSEPRWNGDVPNRPYASIFGGLTSLETGKRVGSIGFDASWQVVHTSYGFIDKPAKFWGQLVKALDMAEKPVGEVLEAVKNYPIELYVQEMARTSDGKWTTLVGDEARTEARKNGDTIKTFVKAVAKAG